MLPLGVFGRALVSSGDLDPVYIALNKARLHRGLVERWALAYWLFYHVGVASQIAEETESGEGFWDACREREKAPRGVERRHMRGRAFHAALDGLQLNFANPGEVIRWLGTGSKTVGPVFGPVPFDIMRRRVLGLTGFGPWISFKVCDMMDACLGHHVDFKGSIPAFFQEPVVGAVWHWLESTRAPGETQLDGPTVRERYTGMSRDTREHVTGAVVDYLAHELKDIWCPHQVRPLGLQEFETILCKWKSHRNGHYEIGHDSREIARALIGWGPLAESLVHYVPVAP